MLDQAAALRVLMAQRREDSPPPPPGTPTLVVGSGKGGVGKSVIAAYAAAGLADRGLRVLLLDGDHNLGNQHVLLGVQPVARLETLLHDDVMPADLIVPVRDNLWLLPGDSGAETLHATGSLERARLHHRLSTLFDEFDVVVIDAGSGIESVVRICAIAASGLAVVTVPEPAALTDAYAVIKIVNMQVPTLPVDVIVNRVVNDGEGKAVFEKLQTASDRFLHRPLDYLGAIPDDSVIADTVRRAGPLLDGMSKSPAAAVIGSLTSTWHARRAAQHDAAPAAIRS